LILRKIIKFVATRCQILGLKCNILNFGWGSDLDPAGPIPRPIAGFRGPTSKGKGKGKGREGKRRGWACMDDPRF